MSELTKEKVLTDTEVEIVAECEEWADDVDDEQDVPDTQMEHAQECHSAREKRLTLAQEELLKDLVLTDVEVDVVVEDKEWVAEVESDHDDSPKRINTTLFEAREKRLSIAQEVIQKEMITTDVEIDVKAETTEWAADADSDNEDVPKQLERRASQAYDAREKRLTFAANIELAEDSIVMDAEVNIKNEGKEWAADGGSDEEDVPKQLERRASQAYAAREMRLSFAEKQMEKEHMLGDGEVAVKEEHKEWAGGSDSEEEASPSDKNATFDQLARRASLNYQEREKRLSVAADALQNERMLGDAQIDVKVENKEWAGADSDDDDGDDANEAEALNMRAQASYNQRERRLTAGQAVIQDTLGSNGVESGSH